MASVVLSTCFAFPVGRSSHRRCTDRAPSKLASAIVARRVTNNHASVFSESKLKKADTTLGQDIGSLQKGLEREVECCNNDEGVIILRRKDGNYRSTELLNCTNTNLGDLLNGNFRALAIGSLVFALVCFPDTYALALGPGGPLMEDFWDNVQRYGVYFFTVVSGGLYSLAKPLLDLLKEPSTQFLVAIAVAGTFFLIYLTVSTMLGLTDFDYQYSQ